MVVVVVVVVVVQTVCHYGLRCYKAQCPRIHGVDCPLQMALHQKTGVRLGTRACAYNLVKPCTHGPQCSFRHFQAGSVKVRCIPPLSVVSAMMFLSPDARVRGVQLTPAQQRILSQGPQPASAAAQADY